MITFSILSHFLAGCVGLLPQLATQAAQPTIAMGESKVGNLPVIVLAGIEVKTNSVAFSLDGKLVACGGEDRRVRIFNETGRLIVRVGGHAAPIRAVAFSPDGTKVVSAGAELLVLISGPLVPSFVFAEDAVPLPRRPPNVATGDRLPLDHMEERVIQPEGQFVKFTKVETGETLRFMGSSIGLPIDSIAYSTDGSSLATFDSGFGLKIQTDRPVPMSFNLRREGMNRDYVDATGIVTSISGDALRLVSVARTKKPLGAIKLWEAKSSRFRDLDPKGMHTSCAMRLDGKRFLIGSQKGLVSEWDFDKGALIRTFDKGSTGTRPVEFLAYSPDGKQIVSGDEAGVVRLYDADKAGLLQTRQGPGRPVRAAAFLPTRVKIASGGHYIRIDRRLPQAEQGSAEPILVWEMGRD